MGCDIHTYIEFSEGEIRGKPYWKAFTKNGGSRNYIMFGVLAGVRVPEAQLFEPKGMPEDDLGYEASHDYWTLVAPLDHPEYADDDSWIAFDVASKWVTSGYSVGEYDDTGRLRRVSGTDWHGHSWLTADELAAALDHYKIKAREMWSLEMSEIPAEWAAMLAAMRAFESAGCKTRLVFWFDN